MTIKANTSFRSSALRALAVAGLLAGGLWLGAQSSQASSGSAEILKPSERHAKISRLATTFFEHSHYRRAKIDDKVSSQILDRYLKVLDGNRLYFTSADINRFEVYRTAMDDFVRTGRVEAVFDIFQTFRTRVRERAEFALATLEFEPNFEEDEEYQFDRSEMPWARDSKELDEIWRKRVKHDLLALRLAEKEGDSARETLSKRYNQVLTRQEQINSDEVFEMFMNAYADTLDPHTNYFSPRNADEYNIQMSLEYFGIGASLQMKDEYVTVMNVIAGGPASVDGNLSVDDRIVGVSQDGEEFTDVVGWRLDDVVQLIRGPRDTVVRLQILPGDGVPGNSEKVLALTRGKVTLENQAAQRDIIEVERPTGKVRLGKIAVPSFYQNYQARVEGKKDYASVTRDVEKHIEALKEEGIDGLIIDLRGNGGGQLGEAVNLTGLFIDSGPIVQLREHNGALRVYRDENKGVAYEGPLVVLVNRFSASASEIFAAAIQDYGRGIVIGQTTFGKGSVQNIYPLDRRTRGDGPRFGQIHLTMGKYYRINGGSTQHRGVVPDIELASAIDASVIGESTRDSALPYDEIKPTRFRDAMHTPLDVNYLNNLHNQRVSADPDYAFLLGDIAITEELRRRDAVSLNEAQRRADRDSIAERRLANVNRWLTAQNLPVVEKLEDFEDDNRPDAQLLETAQILADAITRPLLTKTSPPPDNAATP